MFRYGTRCQWITQFYLPPTCLSTNKINHTCLCLRSRNWSSFTDPGGMEGWVGLIHTIRDHSSRPMFMASVGHPCIIRCITPEYDCWSDLSSTVFQTNEWGTFHVPKRAGLCSRQTEFNFFCCRWPSNASHGAEIVPASVSECERVHASCSGLSQRNAMRVETTLQPVRSSAPGWHENQ